MLARMSAAVLVHTNGRGFLIVGVEKLRNRTLQFADAAMRPPANLLIGELSKPTLHQIQPRVRKTV